MTEILQAFAPVANQAAERLILGSMPGVRSLQEAQYYANRNNTFWWIMQALFGIKLDLPYEHRIEGLKKANIALWDVLKSCRRKGSLDSAIEKDSIVVNDFNEFLGANSRITTIFFNGQAAEQMFKKHALPEIEARRLPGTLTRLPSTSPANARMTKQEKLKQWKQLLTE